MLKTENLLYPSGPTLGLSKMFGGPLGAKDIRMTGPVSYGRIGLFHGHSVSVPLSPDVVLWLIRCRASGCALLEVGRQFGLGDALWPHDHDATAPKRPISTDSAADHVAVKLSGDT